MIKTKQQLRYQLLFHRGVAENSNKGHFFYFSIKNELILSVDIVVYIPNKEFAQSNNEIKC